ncbi:MAG TPA: DUF3105 domain-containing protein [Gaiellaceae bacterium]|nr:DUF3105 domain-containing protein [Gaiellaceae bacterium]
MPRKSETPKPPRRVQAPKQRAAERTPDERRTWRALIVVGALGFLGLAVALGVILFGGSESAAATLKDAGCTVQTYTSQGQAHVQQLPKGFKYNSFPPTTGPHNPVPAPYDFYEQPVEELRLVHNLEHGGIVVQYGSEVPQEQRDRIAAWWRDDPNGIVVASLPALKKTIALAAWTAQYRGSDPSPQDQQGVLAKCPAFDEGAFDAFVDEYGFHGPERFDRIMLAPGT